MKNTKRSKLIELVVEIPSLESIVADSIVHNATIAREHDAVNYLATALEIVAKGTKNEELMNEIVAKCIILSGYEDLADGRHSVSDILKKDKFVDKLNNNRNEVSSWKI